MILVCDTGPLVSLAKLDQLCLLKKLMPAGVIIPRVIQRELWAKNSFETDALNRALNDFIQIQEPQQVTSDVEIATMYLDEGEKQAIRLSTSIKETTLLLIDDNAGRKAAKKLALPVTGTVGILLQAKKKKLIPQVMPLIDQLLKHDYWLSEQLILFIKNEAGE